MAALCVAALAAVGTPVRAQMLADGPNPPGASFNDVTFGTVAWTTPEKAMATDDAYAQAAPGGGFTNYLHADNFDFNIAGPAKIQGIEVNIERHSALGQIKDARVRLVKAGVVGTTDRADTINTWPTSDATATYGGPSDLWGDTWTPADINMNTFGVVLSVTDSGDLAAVDQITMTIHYTLCNDIPAVGCGTATKNILVIKDKMDGAKDKLIWKWIKGVATGQGDFANPTSTATYGLCIYENGALSATAIVPPGLNWTTISTKGYKYKDKMGTSFGIQKVVLKGSMDPKSKILVKGKGAALPPLHPMLTLPVTVQLVNSDTGICWESIFSATPIKNETGLFKAKE